MRKVRKLYDAFPTKREADRSANSLNLAAGVGPTMSNCPRGPNARVRKLHPAQDGGRLKYGVFVLSSCKAYV